jgi:hypothetical protein
MIRARVDREKMQEVLRKHESELKPFCFTSLRRTDFQDARLGRENLRAQKSATFLARNFSSFDVNFCSSKLATAASPLESALLRVLHCPPLLFLSDG